MTRKIIITPKVNFGLNILCVVTGTNVISFRVIKVYYFCLKRDYRTKVRQSVLILMSQYTGIVEDLEVREDISRSHTLYFLLHFQTSKCILKLV